MTGRDGHIAYALPLDQVTELLRVYQTAGSVSIHWRRNG